MRTTNYDPQYLTTEAKMITGRVIKANPELYGHGPFAVRWSIDIHNDATYPARLRATAYRAGKMLCEVTEAI